jgi:hypothetical protein
MQNAILRKSIVVVGVIATVATLALALAYFIPTDRSSSSLAVLKDYVPASSQSNDRRHISGPPAVPQAIIPWKRDLEGGAGSTTVFSPGLPWQRSLASTSPVSVIAAKLPWVHPVEAASLVAVVPAALPWRTEAIELEPSTVMPHSVAATASLPWTENNMSSRPVVLELANLPWRGD